VRHFRYLQGKQARQTTQKAVQKGRGRMREEGEARHRKRGSFIGKKVNGIISGIRVTLELHGKLW
jgi:hypothetical protein